MKYSFLLLILFSFEGFTQNYKAVITAHREQYKQDFLTDKNSPLKKGDLENLHFFDADSSYTVKASVEILWNEKPFPMQTYSGATQQYIRYALLKFVLHGIPQQLTMYKSISLSSLDTYKDYLFLPFTDLSNSEETYGGGRYIDLNAQDISKNQIPLDFNKAYNPYCAYSEDYQCPKPPQENDLKIKIQAGEKQYTGIKKHE